VAAKRVTVGGVTFDALTEKRVVATVRTALRRGEGGWILTPNIDILRQLRRDDAARQVLDETTLVVADGMPVVWASRLAGTPLPARVCGSDLIWSLSGALAADGRSIFVLGGEPAAPAQRPAHGPHSRPPAQGAAHRLTPDRSRPAVRRAVPMERYAVRSGAERAAAALVTRSPGLRVVGAVSPPYGFDADPAAVAELRASLAAARPDLVLVGIGFPRQERLIAQLRRDLPGTWFLGCGMAIGFVAGDQRRAPDWMQRTGVEWMHRLAAEPRRLADRYLRRDLPFAAHLLARAALDRLRSR
jgi:N-acetylglucosaminyldiphosphoundecaprenol N-acetyl-beta-D-mannosaminyltransferase